MKRRYKLFEENLNKFNYKIIETGKMISENIRQLKCISSDSELILDLSNHRIFINCKDCKNSKEAFEKIEKGNAYMFLHIDAYKNACGLIDTCFLENLNFEKQGFILEKGNWIKKDDDIYKVAEVQPNGIDDYVILQYSFYKKPTQDMINYARDLEFYSIANNV